ncbi:Small secreted domain [Nonomuraea solani]|uniref:Small secreted domain n=1 Tax=Nonomuraea solani TaxID=1144553 RepID=A0A1H6D6E8_9ACTN|nr:chaplin family protein [Nonomuraea solani]SEG80363.1 Small secreted domain [Nonomuraea solani]
MLKKVMVVTGAVAMLSLAAPAHADITNGTGGVISGNQLYFPITAPVNVCGNAISVISVVGGAVAGCKGGAVANVNRY